MEIEIQKKIKDLRSKAGTLLGDCRKISEKAEKESRALTTEEQTEYDKRFADLAVAKDTADRLEKESNVDNEMRQTAGTRVGGGASDGNANGSLVSPSSRAAKDATDKEVRAAFQRLEDVGERNLSNEERTLAGEYKSRAFTKYLSGGQRTISNDEHRALSVGSEAGGGYIVAPKEFVGDLIQGVDDELYIQSKATVHMTPDADSLGIPSLDTDPDDPIWTSEVGTGDEDSAMAFGGRELKPQPLGKRIKVSRKLLRMKVIGGKSPEQLVRERFQQKFSVVAENAYLNGNGAKQPLGLFTANAQGISTGRDVSTGNSATAIGADNLREMKYGVKTQYMRRGEWMWHRDALKKISLLKDGNGQYLWRSGLSAAEPDLLLGRTIMMSEYAPNTFTTGQYVGLFGDFSFYHIAISLNFELQRLDELYAAQNQVGFIGRFEADGMPALEEAFVRSKLA